MHMLIKYADDTNLILPSDSDVDLAEEFNYVKHWAEEKRTVRYYSTSELAPCWKKKKKNIAKPQEIVFKRPNPRLFITPQPITEVQQVSYAKLPNMIWHFRDCLDH